MKKCSKCGENKSLSMFHKTKNSACKKCVAERNKKYSKTKKGLVSKIYAHQKHKSKLRGHRPPEYSKESLYDWLFSQRKFHQLHEEWVQSGYKKHLIPSIDRKCDDIHYCMNNIQLMTWGENNNKAYLDRKHGRCTSINKQVGKYSKDGILLEIYHSAKEAERQTSIHQGNISKCCRGIGRTTGGFIWKYLNQGENHE